MKMRRIAWAVAGVLILGCALLPLVIFFFVLLTSPKPSLRDALGILMPMGMVVVILLRGAWGSFQNAGAGPALRRWWSRLPSREIDRMPRVAIRDAGEHRRVKIVGKVRLAGKKLEAPLSQRPCTFYDARVDDESGNLLRETQGYDFFVEDESGMALVKLEAATVVVKLDARYESEGLRATSHQEALLTRHRYSPRGRLTYREGTLTPGEIVAVVGTPYREPDPAGGAAFRDLPFRLVFAARDRDTLFITDDLR
jgi:hypothetical protein